MPRQLYIPPEIFFKAPGPSLRRSLHQFFGAHSLDPNLKLLVLDEDVLAAGLEAAAGVGVVDEGVGPRGGVVQFVADDLAEVGEGLEQELLGDLQRQALDADRAAALQAGGALDVGRGHALVVVAPPVQGALPREMGPALLPIHEARCPDSHPGPGHGLPPGLVVAVALLGAVVVLPRRILAGGPAHVLAGRLDGGAGGAGGVGLGLGGG